MKRFILPLLVFFILSSCDYKNERSLSDAQIENPSQELNFVHTVFFWLTEDCNAEERAEFEKGLSRLGKAESIGKFHMGVPSYSNRDVVDDSYDYAWIVHFTDRKAEESYQKDSLHLEFIENYSQLWEKVIVYDTELKEQN